MKLAKAAGEVFLQLLRGIANEGVGLIAAAECGTGAIEFNGPDAERAGRDP
jgi:hypothetical protein